MRHTMLFIIILFCIVSNAQSYKIEYERISIEDYEEGENRINLTTLFFNKEKSIFIEDRVVNGYSTELSIEDYKANIKGRKILGDSLGQVVIKYINRNIYKQRRRASDYKKSVYVNVSDSILPDFNWSLKSEFKNILNYKVEKATTTYMNRKITVWFTKDITIPDGPWKFSNLPGLILEASIKLTKNTRIIYKAISLSKINSLPALKLPKTRIQDLKKIEENYISKYNNLYKYYKTQSDGQISLRKDDLDFKPIVFDEN